MATIGLAMIVKDEARVIARALDSVRPLVDHVLVEDTGSTDGTQKVVEDWLAANGVPGSVVEEPWRNFGYNRTHVLAQIRKVDVDYAFMLDADEIVKFDEDPDAIKQKFSADIYHVDMRLGTIGYALPRLTRNSMPFFYRGPAHEWPDCKEPYRTGRLKGMTIVEMSGGARERDPDTYRKDAALFEEELKRTDLDPLELTRYTFYFAQSLRDCREQERALEIYLRRAEMGGWHEEVYVSLLNAARLKQRLNHPLTKVIETYKRAMAINPRRAEAIHGAAQALRTAGLFHEAYAIAQRGIRLPMHEGLFTETWIYEYGLLDEYSVSAYHAGHRPESWLATQLALRTQNLDEATRKRLVANAAFAAND